MREVSEEEYDEILDDCYGEIEVCGLTYWASSLLKCIDPIAYRCGLSDYESSLEEEE
tara:strand:+ start:338 stop:508 length:171 start_codon:yes stop_codon:yes gene_type:complete